MPDNIAVATEVISSFVSNNSVPASELPGLIVAVVSAFDNLGKAPTAEERAPKPVPAVPVRKSVFDEYLVSLETGEKFQTLRRHLSVRGMTPDEYREKWGLPKDYPMTATAYSERRSALAKSLGLGRKAAEPVLPPAEPKKPRSKPKPTVASERPVEGAQDAADSVQEAA